MFNDLSAVLSVPFFGVEFRTIALSLLILVATILFKTVLTDLIFSWLRHLTSKTKATWDDNLLIIIQKPVSMFILVLGVYISLRVLPLTPDWIKGLTMVFRALTTVVVFWGLIRATAVGAELLTEYGQKKGLAVATFVPLFRQIVIVILAIICVVMIIDNLGFSVSSIIAALGIGGAAIAFASQSTIANLYGSIAIALDRPFKVGDMVKIGTTEGTVESIGLRSTQIRTVTKTLVSIPNNTIANEAVDNFTLMPQRRITATIGLTYGVTQAQIEAIIADVKAVLAEMKTDIAKESQFVHLSAFADSSVNLEVICFTQSSDIKEFFRIRQQVLLSIMKIVEKNGAEMAFPTRTIHMVKES